MFPGNGVFQYQEQIKYISKLTPMASQYTGYIRKKRRTKKTPGERLFNEIDITNPLMRKNNPTPNHPTKTVLAQGTSHDA